MKITNENVGNWILALIFCIWCKSMWTIGIPCGPEPLNPIELLNLIGLLFFMAVIGFISVFEISRFFYRCSENEIKFEIDLLSIFKRRTQSPEEQDRKKK